MIRSLLFDLDNTLVDRNAAHRRYWQWFLTRPEYPKNRTMRADNITLELLVEQDDFGCRDRSEYFSWAAGFLNLWTAERLWEHYRNHLPHFIEPNPGIVSLLQELRRDYRLALVSNGSSRMQRAKLESAGLATLFDHILISQECGASKPSPDIFEFALRKIQYAPRQALYIGDDPVRDIAGARAVGCRTCWVSHQRRFPPHLEEPNWTITSVLGLNEVLACSTGVLP